MQHDSPSARTPWGAFSNLAFIQYMNSLNEKGVQFLLVALGIWLGQDLQYPLGILIVLPFVLFSPLGGWLADRYCKTRLLQGMVLLQVFVLAGMSFGLFYENLWLAVGFFALFCVQAMFFSPAKKGLVKDMVGSRNIGFASGILEVTSLMALLLGQIGALFIVYILLQKWGPEAGWHAAAWPCFIAMFGAILVFFLSLGIPRYEPQSARPFRWSLLWEHFAQLKMLWDNKVLRHCEVGIGYFWFIAGTMVLIALQMASEAHPLATDAHFLSVLEQQKDSGLLFAWISGGSIAGGILASIICGKQVRLWIAHVGSIGMTIGCVILSFATYDTVLFYVGLAMAGFMASGFLVPLNALLQDRADNDNRGNVIAAGNLVDCFLGIMAVVVQFSMREAGLDTHTQCGVLAVMSVCITIYIYRHFRSLKSL